MTRVRVWASKRKIFRMVQYFSRIRRKMEVCPNSIVKMIYAHDFVIVVGV